MAGWSGLACQVGAFVAPQPPLPPRDAVRSALTSAARLLRALLARADPKLKDYDPTTGSAEPDEGCGEKVAAFNKEC